MNSSDTDKGTRGNNRELDSDLLDIAYCKLMMLADLADELRKVKQLSEWSKRRDKVPASLYTTSCDLPVRREILPLVNYTDSSKYLNTTNRNELAEFIRGELNLPNLPIKPYGFMYDFRNPGVHLSAGQAFRSLAVGVKAFHSSKSGNGSRSSVLLPRYYMMKSGLEELAELPLQSLMFKPLLPVTVGIAGDKGLGILRYGFNEDLLPMLIRYGSVDMDRLKNTLQLVREALTTANRRK